MIRIALCDYDTIFKCKLKKMILNETKQTSEFLFYEYDTVEELVSNVWQMHDLVLATVNFQKSKELEAAKLFRYGNKEALFIVFSSQTKLPMDIFQIQPYRYFLKEVALEKLNVEMKEILYEMIRREKTEYLNVTGDGKVYRIPIKSITYISVLKRGCAIHIFPGKNEPEIHCRETLLELYERLERENFAYAHNSYIVNMQNIILLSKSILILKDQTQLNISRSKKKKFDEAFSDFVGLVYKREHA